MAFRLSGDQHLESPAALRPHRVEAPRGLAAGDHILNGLPPRAPHERLARYHRGEDQRPTATRFWVEHQPQPAIVDVQLLTRLAVDPRRPIPGSSAAYGRNVRYGTAITCRASRLCTLFSVSSPCPATDAIVVGPAGFPTPPSPARTVRPDCLRDIADQHVGQLTLTVLGDELCGHRPIDVTTDRLAVCYDRLCDRS